MEGFKICEYTLLGLTWFTLGEETVSFLILAESVSRYGLSFQGLFEQSLLTHIELVRNENLHGGFSLVKWHLPCPALMQLIYFKLSRHILHREKGKTGCICMDSWSEHSDQETEWLRSTSEVFLDTRVT